MKNMLRFSLYAAVVGLASAATWPAAAQSTWNFGGSGCAIQGSGTSTQASCTSNDVSATATAYSSSPSGSNFVRATMTYWSGSGIGIYSANESGSPQHSIESQGADEAVLIDFGNKNVSLTELKVGWSYNDTDITVLRWTGTAAPGPSLTSTAGAASLVSKGWEIVKSADLDGVATNNGTTFGQNTMTIDTTATSSWWLVTAYFGSSSNDLETGETTTTSTTKTCTKYYYSGGPCKTWSNVTTTTTINNYDYFKLLSVSGKCTSQTNGNACDGTPPPSSGVPTPGSMALAGLGLGGLLIRRRRRKLIAA